METYYVDKCTHPPAADGLGKPVSYSGTQPAAVSAGFVPWVLTRPVAHLETVPLDPSYPRRLKNGDRGYQFSTNGYGYRIVASRGPTLDWDMHLEDYVLDANGDIERFVSHYGVGDAVEYDPATGLFSSGDIFRSG